jgi:hypothetical protein
MITETERNLNNQQALDNPRPGDYWHERFSPYFVIVNREGDQYRVLSCMGGPHHYLRKNELNARIEIDRDHWAFDYSKSMLVDHEWMRRAVTYGSIDGFVADVVRTEKTALIVTEWREHKRLAMLKEIERLEEEYEKFTGWKYLKEGIA